MAALQRALAKGLNFAHDNQGKLREIYPTFTTLQPALAQKIVLSYTPEKSDFTQLKKIGDMMDRLEMLPGKTKLPDAAMPRYDCWTQAMAGIGNRDRRGLRSSPAAPRSYCCRDRCFLSCSWSSSRGLSLFRRLSAASFDSPLADG